MLQKSVKSSLLQAKRFSALSNWNRHIIVAPKVKGTDFSVPCFNGFTQCHACVVQTTTRYAGVHKKLYKKITNRITIRMFKSIVKKKGDFNGK